METVNIYIVGRFKMFSMSRAEVIISGIPIATQNGMSKDFCLSVVSITAKFYYGLRLLSQLDLGLSLAKNFWVNIFPRWIGVFHHHRNTKFGVSSNTTSRHRIWPPFYFKDLQMMWNFKCGQRHFSCLCIIVIIKYEFVLPHRVKRSYKNFDEQ